MTPITFHLLESLTDILTLALCVGSVAVLIRVRRTSRRLRRARERFEPAVTAQLARQRADSALQVIAAAVDRERQRLAEDPSSDRRFVDTVDGPVMPEPRPEINVSVVPPSRPDPADPYANIYRMAEAGLPPARIAETTEMSPAAVDLALKLRNRRRRSA